MPRKLIKKYMPDEATLREHKHLSWLGDHLHDPNLWHLNRKSVPRAFLVGIFCAFLPIPMQMLVAAVLALICRSNLPISVGLVWLTNPLTMPPIFYFTYLVGTSLLGTPPQEFRFELEWEALTHDMAAIWWPLLFGSLVSGVFFGLLSFLGMRSFWAWHVNKSWQKRKARRSCQK